MIAIDEKVSVALARVTSAVKLFDPIEVFGLYSGGHDSFSACYVASLHPRFSGAVHINTGIGVEATREHVRETCSLRHWKLLEYKAMENIHADGTPDPQDFDKWCMKFGFPGPGQHGTMYSLLKERQLRRLQRDAGCSGRGKYPKRVLYVTGARSGESIRRMGNTHTQPEIEPQAIWVNAIHDWTKQDTSDLIELARAKRNLVVDLIHKSGECLCGAFAKKGELSELSMWPQTRPAYDRIIALQESVKAAGFPWGWEDAPPLEYMEEQKGQLFIPEAKQHLCLKCNMDWNRKNLKIPVDSGR